MPQNEKDRLFLEYLFEIISVGEAAVMPPEPPMNCSHIDHSIVAIEIPEEQIPEKFVPYWIRPVLTKQEKMEDGF